VIVSDGIARKRRKWFLELIIIIKTKEILWGRMVYYWLGCLNFLGYDFSISVLMAKFVRIATIA